jgi:hypothetical protein
MLKLFFLKISSQKAIGSGLSYFINLIKVKYIAKNQSRMMLLN